MFFDPLFYTFEQYNKKLTCYEKNNYAGHFKLLSLMACSVENDELELNAYNAQGLNATMECTDFLGSDNFTGSLTVRNKAGVTDIKGWTAEDLEAYIFANLLESGVPQDGVFSPLFKVLLINLIMECSTRSFYYHIYVLLLMVVQILSELEQP